MTLESKVKLARALTLIGYVGLLVLYALWFLLLQPAASDHPWVIWLIHTLPLAAFAPPIIRRSPRPHAWLCFILLLYFMESVLASLVPHSRWLGLTDAALVCTLFIGAMLFARWQSQLNRQQAQARSQPK